MSHLLMQLKSKHRQSVEQYNFDALSEKEILQLFPLPPLFPNSL